MATATFRFHEKLNDFLPRERRGREFPCRCAQAATVKHMIEALGVPHTEAGIVLVNGETAGFDRLLAEGDHVEAYPWHGMQAADGMKTDAKTSPPQRFIADAHLGGLARLLRMAGFDTLYDNHFHDREIGEIAARDDRIVLTRDRELLKRRNIHRGCYVRALKANGQLPEIFERFGLAQDARPFTLCMHCNAPLRPIDKAIVQEHIPPKVRLYHEKFNTCDICHRIYWKGSHWQRMQMLMQKVSSAE